MLKQTRTAAITRSESGSISGPVSFFWRLTLTLCLAVWLTSHAPRAVAAEDKKDKEVKPATSEKSESNSKSDSDSESDEDSSESEDSEDEDEVKQTSAQTTAATPVPSRSSSRSSQSDDGFSALFRIGVQPGSGVVQNQSLIPIELFPYILSDDQLFFSDLRFYSTDDVTLGGNAGLGYRRYSSGLDRIWGISGWYDGDNSREDNYFNQFGVSLETYGDLFDFRTNFYMPFGDTYQQKSLRLVSNSAHFQGQNLLYDQVRSFYSAMAGFDLEAGIPLPGRFLEDRGVRIYGGMYHYVDDNDETITGASARITANLFEGLDVGVQVTNDSFFDTRAFLNVAWTFGPLHRSQMSQRNMRGRLGEHVTRNYTVLAPEQNIRESNIVASNPANGQAYEFAHVDSAASPGGTGDFNSEFQTIADAQAAGRDIVFVHAGSTFNGANATIVMNSGERILGDGNGIEHFLNVPGLRTLLIPHGPTGGNAPILNTSLGDSVTLASNSEFSGFSITNSIGDGVFGNGVQNVLMHHVTVQNAGADGMQFLNSTGSIAVLNSLISGANGHGLNINGGTPNFLFGGTISSNNGYDALVQNTGGLVDLREANFGGTGSQGILVDNVAGDVQFKDVSLDNTAGKGIEIVDVSGNVEFEGTTFVNDAADESIEIRNLASNGNITFRDVEIHNRNNRGFAIDNNDGVVSVEGSLEVANQNNVAASAIDVQNSSGNALLGPTVVTAATGNPGVNIENNTGTTSISSLNVTANNGTGLFANNGGTLRINPDAVLANGGEINVTNGTAVDIEDTALNIALRQVTSSNAAVGLRLVSTTGLFGVFGDGPTATNTGGTISNATVGIFLQDVETVALSSMNLQTNGTGLQTNDVDNLGIVNFRVENSTTHGFALHNTRLASISYSNFTGSGQDDIHATFSEVATNNYAIHHNEFLSDNGDSIRFESQGGSAGAVMNMQVSTNNFTNTFASGAALDVDWNGTLSSTVVHNAVIAQGGSSFVADISNAAAAANTNVIFSDNDLLGQASNLTFLNLTAAGPTTVGVSQNIAQFGGANFTGYKFGLGANSVVNIVGNTIGNSSGGTTAVLFDSLTGRTDIGFSGNIFALGGSGGSTDRGVIFNSITNPVIGSVTQYVTLTSAANNAIAGFDTLFSRPAGTTTGFLVINGGMTPP